MKIREGTPADGVWMLQLYRSAFDEGESESVAGLAHALLLEESVPRTVHLVGESEGELVGHVSFSPVFDQSSKVLMGFILAPLAVTPDWQKQGVGSELVREGLARVRQAEGELVLVYGAPSYYERFGFEQELAKRFLPPYPLEHPFGWQALALGAGGVPDEPVSIECVPALSQPDLW